MAAENTVPSPAHILAKINAALAESGLKHHKAVREPLPLFRYLLQEWYSNLEMENASEEAIFFALIEKHHIAEVQANLRSIFNEAINLSSAHGTLSAWTRKEIDQEMRRMQGLLEKTQQQHLLNALKHS